MLCTVWLIGKPEGSPAPQKGEGERLCAPRQETTNAWQDSKKPLELLNWETVTTWQNWNPILNNTEENNNNN